MNRVTLVGNIGKDPDFKVLRDGTELAKFSMATTDLYRAKNGEMQSNTQWHSVVLWRGLADLAKNYLRKGSLLLLEGRISYRNYEDEHGVKKYVTEIIGEELILLDKKMVQHLDEGDAIRGAMDSEPLPF